MDCESTLDDQRARLRNMGLDYVNGLRSPPGPQVPSVAFSVDPFTGQITSRATTTQGIDFLADKNSTPPSAPRQQSNARDFAHGGASVEFVRVSPPIGSGGINFL